MILAIEIGHHRQGQGLHELVPGPLQIAKLDQGRSVVEVALDRRVSRNGGVEQGSDPVPPPPHNPGNLEVPERQSVQGTALVGVQLEGPLELAPHLVSQIQRAKCADELGEPAERSCQLDVDLWNPWIDSDSRAGVLRRLNVASTSFRLIQGIGKGIGKGRNSAGKLVSGLDIGRVPLDALSIRIDGLRKSPGIVSSISCPDIGEGDGSQEQKRACEPSPPHPLAPPE